MAGDEIAPLSDSTEPTIGICDGSLDCLAMAGGHLKTCARYQAIKDSNRVIALPGDKRVFISGANENTLGPVEGKRTNSEPVDWDLVAKSIERMAQAAGVAGREAARALAEQEAEDERERVIASWANPLDMIESEFPDVAVGETWWTWRVYLKVLWALDLDEVELAFAQKMTGRTIMPTKPVRRAYCGSGRRGGKSFIAAVQAVFHAVKPRTWVLAPGETSTIPVIASTREQARVLHGYIKGLFEASPRLAAMVEGTPTKDTVTLTNRTQIKIFTASYKTSRGYSLAAAFGDETAFWENSETSSNPDTEIINAIRPGLMTTRGPLIITSTPYSKRGVLWNGYRSYFGVEEADGIYWKAASLDMNANLDPDEIARAYEEDPEAAAAEYGGEFRSDLAAFISEELLASVTIPGRGDLPYAGARYQYHAFVDPSGGSIGGDSFTLAIGHSEGKRHIVDCIREVTPPFSTDGTVTSFCETLVMYGVKAVHGDKYAGEWPTQSFRDHGSVSYHQSEFPKSDLYLQALPLITSGVVELPEHKRLLAQFRALERRTSRAGKDSIDHPPRGKDDVSNAVAGLLALLARKRRSWGHLGVFGYSNDGKHTTFFGGAGGDTEPPVRWEDRACPACGRAITGYMSYEAPDILKEMAEHWVKYAATKAHIGKTPPIKIEEMFYERER